MSSFRGSFSNENDDLWIYHERQEAALCGQHALNNLLQSNAFSPDALADIAQELDQVELAYMADNNEGGVRSKEYLQRLQEGSHNVDEQGNFSIQVLRVALQQLYGLQLPNIQEEGILSKRRITDINGFICNRSSHWFAIRRIHGKYWNLNSTMEKPQWIGDFALEVEMEALQKEGYSVFCVTDQLPLPHRDETKRGFVADFWWKPSDLLSTENNKETTRDPWENVGSGMRLDGKPIVQQTTENDALEHLSEEKMMQMAVMASMQEQNTTCKDEPPPDAKGVVKIQFRLPNGQRVIRRFLETDTVNEIYAYCANQCPNENKSLELRSGFPPKDLSLFQKETICTAKLSGEMIQGRFV